MFVLRLACKLRNTTFLFCSIQFFLFPDCTLYQVRQAKARLYIFFRRINWWQLRTNTWADDCYKDNNPCLAWPVQVSNSQMMMCIFHSSGTILYIQIIMTIYMFVHQTTMTQSKSMVYLKNELTNKQRKTTKFSIGLKSRKKAPAILHVRFSVIQSCTWLTNKHLQMMNLPSLKRLKHLIPLGSK